MDGCVIGNNDKINGMDRVTYKRKVIRKALSVDKQIGMQGIPITILFSVAGFQRVLILPRHDTINVK